MESLCQTLPNVAGRTLPSLARSGGWTRRTSRLSHGQCRTRAHLARSINAPNIVVSSDPFLPSPLSLLSPVTTLSARHPAPRIVAVAISSCAQHVRSLGSESLLSNLMEVKD